MNIEDLHLIVATPCYGGVVTQRYMQSTLALMQAGTACGFTVQIELLGYDSLITRSRNTLVARFLDTPGASHLLFVDADIGFEVAQVARMLQLGEDLVAGMYPLKLIDWDPSALARAYGGEPVETAPIRYVGTPCEGADRRERDGFVTGLYAGTGFMLLRRAALETMVRAYAHTRYTAIHTGQTRPTNNQFALFDCMIEPETGHYLSEDYTFCRRWREAGGTIWLDTQGALHHVGPHEFHGRPDLRWPLPAPAA
ncbi:MAG: hypothetical protein JSR21_10470 [Proteobacteria bacterium]|nr:hypothetical protein [Pseudomonadota bacterium]